MRINSLRFGELEIPEESVLTFPEGLWGFADAQLFCLLPYAVGHPMRWLQSLENPALAFVTVNPLEFFPDYEIVLAESDREALGLEQAEDALVLALLTISHDRGAITANLAGPIVINTRARRARQIIVDDPRYSTRHLVAELSGTFCRREE